ncbi:hypothetical protein TcasGA2_TC008052 [Tribolium castaneum]|uniref:Uncharacterized protein n=1 Tax=Tribolium castaneum TaxID=7070 RepID=D1ZZI8_TRICA|nr:hypothetical protein TcasGA2_TC008052 [Tribolium castaneum]
MVLWTGRGALAALPVEGPTPWERHAIKPIVSWRLESPIRRRVITAVKTATRTSEIVSRSENCSPIPPPMAGKALLTFIDAAIEWPPFRENYFRSAAVAKFPTTLEKKPNQARNGRRCGRAVFCRLKIPFNEDVTRWKSSCLCITGVSVVIYVQTTCKSFVMFNTAHGPVIKPRSFVESGQDFVRMKKRKGCNTVESRMVKGWFKHRFCRCVVDAYISKHTGTLTRRLLFQKVCFSEKPIRAAKGHFTEVPAFERV